MAWAQEIIDFVLKFKPYTEVNEYQNGLYFWAGRVLDWKIPDKKIASVLAEKGVKLEDIVAEENKIASDYKKDSIISKHNPFKRPTYPDGYRKSLFFANPLHPKRFSKNRPWGVYFHLPSILFPNRVEVVPIREVVKDLKFISVLSEEKSGPKLINSKLIIDGQSYSSRQYVGKSFRQKISDSNIALDVEDSNAKDYISTDKKFSSIFFSGFIRYQIEDAYKAYTQVQDWERSYHSQVLLVMSKLVRAKSLDYWVTDNGITDCEREIKDSLNKSGPVRKDWGIWTSEFGITDVVPHKLVRNVNELYVPDEGIRLVTENTGRE